MSKLREYFASNIKKYRKERKLTQADLAELYDTSANYIAIIETCNRFPREDMIEKIAQALMVEPFELFLNPDTIHVQDKIKKDEFIAKLVEFFKKEMITNLDINLLILTISA